jgi:uncharacterized membrane protein
VNLTNPLFIIPALTGPAFLIIGALMLKFPPAKINSLYGYRTSNSMKSQERWDFAQIFSAKEMIKGGGLLAFTSIIGLFYTPNEIAGTVLGCSLMIAAFVMLVINTERAITKKFDKP